MKNTLKVVLVLISLTLFSFSAHKFYLSMTIVEHDIDREALEFSTKFFADDLQRVLEKNYQIDFDLTDKTQEKTVNILLEKYLKTNLKININNSPVKLNYVGADINMNSVWLHYEILDIKKVTKVIASNSFFYKVFEEQNNIMNIKIGTEKRTLMFSKDASKRSVEFNKIEK